LTSSSTGTSHLRLDVALLVDTTGTMGTYVGELRRHLVETIAEIDRQVDGARVGVVAFKDHGHEGEEETYLTRALPLTADRARLLEFVGSPALAPGEGGGGAEAVECALRVARGMSWRPVEEARRVIVLVGDKPPHGAGLDALSACPYHVDYRDEVDALARAGVVIHTVQVGDHLVTRRVFEFIAATTGGSFLDLEHVRDLPSLVASVCLKEGAGELSLMGYRRRLEAMGRLTGTRRSLFATLMAA
jgi:hypothetical protein